MDKNSYKSNLLKNTRLVIRRYLKRLFPRLIAFNDLIRDCNSYLYSTGWIRSLEQEKSLDKDGKFIPWMNFSVIKLLEDRLDKDLEVFEFGSGYSTYFYARKTMAVTSVEHNNLWFQQINKELPENVSLIYKEKDVDGDYCRSIGETSKLYDVVIVDGRDRVNCIKQSSSALSLRGVILLDDSQRERYREGLEFANRLGFKRLDIEGLKPGERGINRTTILYRDYNCLGI